MDIYSFAMYTEAISEHCVIHLKPGGHSMFAKSDSPISYIQLVLRACHVVFVRSAQYCPERNPHPHSLLLGLYSSSAHK